MVPLDSPAVRPVRHAVLVAVAVLSVFPGAGSAAEFFVAVDGADAAARDGTSPQAAWKSLAYACERVPAGRHTIKMGPGTYIATRTARPRNGVTIEGAGARGPKRTRIIASADWPLPPLKDYEGTEGRPEYLIGVEMKQPSGERVKPADLTIRHLELASDPKHRITGAVYCRDGTNVRLEHLHVHDFRWNGLRVEFSAEVEIAHCLIEDASTEKLPHREGGLIRTRWIRDSRIHHNRIIARETRGYGYKGSGHRGMRFDHNYVDTQYFAFESPHENEFGVEIDHNYLTRCISVPKPGQGADPTKEGFAYSVRIHHNVLTDSYTVEGPRNHLRLDHNWIPVEKTGGRIYTHHGGRIRGPVWIHHNVIENVDRNFVWMNEGLAENIQVYNNTVFCADAGDRTGHLLDAYTAERLSGWVFKNNVAVAPESRPRQVHPMKRGVPGKMTVAHNLFVNFTEVPAGNLEADSTGLRCRGAKPVPFFLPAGASSPVVDRGVDVGLPFRGKAPDLGAFEYGMKPWTLEDIPQP
jgi:hypothetical protein